MFAYRPRPIVSLAPIGLVILILLLAGCGSSNPAGPNPTPTPTASCTQTVVFQESGGVPANNAVFRTFTTTRPGRIDAVLDWTFTDSFMGLAVYKGECDIERYIA